MATMQDVATLAGVSVSTVSYALSSTRAVSSATKARVIAAIDQLGYEPNLHARGLASRRSSVLALVYPAMERGLGGTVAEFVASAAATAVESGFRLVLWPFGSHQAADIAALVRQGMADGVLLMEVRLHDERVEALVAGDVPFTLIGRTDDVDGLSYVDIDFARTTEDAIAHLVGLGHRHVGFLNHSRSSLDVGYAPTVRAAQGYHEAMVARGLDPVAVLCDESPDAGRAAMRELLWLDPDLTAVVTMNEIATFGATVELQSLGRRIPTDFSVLAIATSPGVGAMSSPRLTTMHAPGAALGRLGVQSLLARLRAHEVDNPGPVLLPCPLVPGESTGPVPTEPLS